jgi:hypothetical protein
MSPTSVGLMITWVMRLSPEPSLAGVIFQRTLSPTFRSFTPSPGSSARSQTNSGAQTMVGSVEPNTKTVAPASPRAGISRLPAQSRPKAIPFCSLGVSLASGPENKGTLGGGSNRFSTGSGGGVACP